MYWLRIKIKVKGTGVLIVLWCGLDRGTRQFLMCWLRIKIKGKGTGVLHPPKVSYFQCGHALLLEKP